MTNPPSSEYEPVDPSVRTFLWRLRARLVTPPTEERVAADLDRLFLAAREHAHGEPLFGDVVRIDSAAPSSADTTTPNLSERDVEGLPAGVTPMFGTEPVDTSPWARLPFGTLLGRVAAAAVLLVAVGGGIAGARDGSVTLTTLLGRSAVPEVAADDALLALDADPELTAEPAEEPPAEPDAGEDPAQDAAPEPADTTPTGDAATSDEADDPVETPPTEPADPSGPTATADRPNDGADTSGDVDAAPEPDSGDSSAPEPDDGDATGTEPVEDVIIAAPPEPRPVDGFGGPTCPEDGDPSLCDDADGSEGSDPDASGEGDADAEDPDGTGESEQDELARRRGGA